MYEFSIEFYWSKERKNILKAMLSFLLHRFKESQHGQEHVQVPVNKKKKSVKSRESASTVKNCEA